MPYYGSLLVTDPSGWTKSFLLEKAINMVGTADHNDIVLPIDQGGSVAPVHLQVIRPQMDTNRIRVVNLARSVCTLNKPGFPGASLLPNNSMEMEGGDTLQLGGYRLEFNLLVEHGVVKSSRTEHLGARIELPSKDLPGNKDITGKLTVSNFGPARRCQFELELDGLDTSCYTIDPAPLLFPNSEEALQIRLIHRGTKPSGGPLNLVLRAAAPAAYPTEEVILPFSLNVATVRNIEVKVIEPEKVPASPPAQPAFVPQAQGETPAKTTISPEVAAVAQTPQAPPPGTAAHAQNVTPMAPELLIPIRAVTMPAPVTAVPDIEATPALSKAEKPQPESQESEPALARPRRSKPRSRPVKSDPLRLVPEPIEPPDAPHSKLAPTAAEAMIPPSQTVEKVAGPIEESLPVMPDPPAEGDWWENTPPAPSGAGEPFARVGPTKKARFLPAGQNIQVLRSAPAVTDEDSTQSTEEPKP